MSDVYDLSKQPKLASEALDKGEAIAKAIGAADLLR